jgi:4-amino-4-deoxy-L-arabinose transferase-like glycosyltransferase
MIRALFVVFMIALAVMLFVNRSESVVGADASGYAGLARMLEEGRTVEPTPLACATCEPYWFVPIGFVAVPGEPAMISMYPVGLPLHLALAERIRGGMFVVSPLAGWLLVLCTYWLGRRLHSELAGVVAAMLIALCAVFVMQTLQPMSDVLAAMWSTAAVAAAVEGRRRPWCSVLAGLCFGVAVLVRPTSALLLLPLAFALGGVRPALRFVIGGLPAALVFGWYNVTTFGKLIEFGYGVSGATREFALSYFPARALHYVRWTVEQFSPIAVIAAIVGLVMLPRRERWLLGSWLAAFFLVYSFYYSYEAWWYTRFLIPAYPALAVAAGVAFTRLMQMRRMLAVATLIVVMTWELRQLVRFSAFYTDEDQERFRIPPEVIARTLPPRSLVFSMEFSGSIAYYSDHPILRWDLAPPDRALAFARGINAPVYALIMRHEEERFRSKYGNAFVRLHTFGGGTLFGLRGGVAGY